LLLGVNMGFFKEQLTDVELMQKEIDRNSRIGASGTYILDEDNFVEVKIGGKNANKLDNEQQLSSKRNDNVSDRGRDKASI
jgi:hypothetical protein